MRMIIVESPGFYTSLQDKGRKGFRSLGVPVSGPMDVQAFDLANALLPNEADFCVFECTLIGPCLRLEREVRFVVTGAQITVLLNGVKVAMNKVHTAPENSILKMSKVYRGIRSYLRFEAEIISPVVLGSKSFFSPISSQKSICKGDIIPYHSAAAQRENSNAQLRVNASYMEATCMTVFPGPDWSLLTNEQQQHLLEEPHRVEAQNRMGYRLSSNVNVNAPALLSQLVVPGMVQLTPGGKLLIATADCQVTGGYLQVLQLESTSLNCLVQKREGEVLTFQNIHP